MPFAQNPQRSVSLVAKLAGPAGGIAASLRAELEKLDPDGALYNAQTFNETMARQFRRERFRTALVSIFAVLAALLAGVGIYGAMAFSVAQRTREFALRIALGAMPAAIERATLARTARLTLGGAGFGLGIALAVGELVKSELYLVPKQHSGVLFGVGIHDPVSLMAAAAIVVVLALFASMVPAARAARADPATELRQEQARAPPLKSQGDLEGRSRGSRGSQEVRPGHLSGPQFS